MTLVIQILKGQRWTLWNCTKVELTPTGATVHHTDREPTPIQGWVESIKRREHE